MSANDANSKMGGDRRTRRLSILPWMVDDCPAWLKCLFVTGFTTATYLARSAMGVAFGERPLMIMFIFPIILSSYLWGAWTGLFSTILSATIIDYFLIPPTHSLLIAETHDLIQLLMLIANGIIISLLVEALHRNRADAEKHSKGFEDTNRKLVEEICERKRAVDALNNKNQELERFTYMVSHDLKSPLVTIKTFLGYLGQDMEQTDRKRAEEDISLISGAADKMGRLLDELLEMSRIGRTGNDPQLVEYRQLVEEAVGLVSGQIMQRGVEIRIADDRIRLFGDCSRLLAIWQNLLENSVKYMGDQTSPLIEIGVEGSGPETLFYVCDNGIGIDPADLDSIFDFGVMVDRKCEGSGLGLAMTKKIIGTYGGTIQAVSAGRGDGTCFRFTLPDAVRKGGDNP